MAGASCSNIEAHRQPTRRVEYSRAVRDSESGHVKPTAAGPLSWFGNMTGISSLRSKKLEFYSSFYGGAEPALPPHVSAAPITRAMPYRTPLYSVNTRTQQTHTMHTYIQTHRCTSSLPLPHVHQKHTRWGGDEREGRGRKRERAVEHQGRRAS